MSIPRPEQVRRMEQLTENIINWSKYAVEPLDTGASNIVALSPVQEFSEVEALLLVVMAAQMMKTPEGQKNLTTIITKYLDNMGKVISTLNKSAGTHPWNNMVNQFVSVGIYHRIGLMGSGEALQTKLWIDHVLGEALKYDYVMAGLKGLDTLVDASTDIVTTKEEVVGRTDVAGWMALAKLFSKE